MLHVLSMLVSKTYAANLEKVFWCNRHKTKKGELFEYCQIESALNVDVSCVIKFSSAKLFFSTGHFLNFLIASQPSILCHFIVINDSQLFLVLGAKSGFEKRFLFWTI